MPASALSGLAGRLSCRARTVLPSLVSSNSSDCEWAQVERWVSHVPATLTGNLACFADVHAFSVAVITLRRIYL
jgi:hypothetical protein